MSAAAAQPRKTAAERGLRAAMAPLHTWLGLLFGWLLFAVFVTGTASYFRDEMSIWMRPEIGQAASPAPDIAAAAALRQLAASSAGARRWMIDLPTDRSPVTSAIVFGVPKAGAPFARLTLDASSGAPIAVRPTAGGDFFYAFHYDLYMPWRLGRYLVASAAIAMLVAFISGVIVHRRIFKDFFTFRPRKGQRSWLDAHNALGVLALPFHVMITYTGLITLQPMYLPWSIDAMYPDGRPSFVAELFYEVPPRKPEGVAAPLTDIGPLLTVAAGQWHGGSAGRIIVDNPGDRAATIRLVRQHNERVSCAIESTLFDGATGTVISASGEPGPGVEAYGLFYGLHLARFSDVALRWLFFISGIAGTAMIATGLLLWAAKRRRDAAGFGHHLVDVLNVTAITGVPIAIAVFFLCNRLLPAALAGRAGWEIAGFFAAWLIAGLHAAIRRRQAWRDQLWSAAFLFAAVPAVNALTTGRGLWRSLKAGDGLFAGFDLLMLATASSFALAAVVMARYHPPARSSRR